MKRTITQINPSSAARVVSLTFVIIVGALVMVGIAAAMLGHGSSAALLANAKGDAGWAFAVTPFIYMIFIYFVIFGACYAFNLSTRFFGGIRIELAD
jgi:uncharacterized BrkB/YihY/UPF0761 family membrane protein